MIEKIGPIKNPLTIIAIFAAIAEVSGSVVLPFISIENQSLYIWFLMSFPVFLVMIFFVTLNFNHKVLYAPSDYKDEDNFIKSLSKGTALDAVSKIEEEIRYENKNNSGEDHKEVPYLNDEKLPYYGYWPNEQAKALLANELVFNKLGSEFSSEIQRSVKTESGSYLFDGVVYEDGKATVIEMMYPQNGWSSNQVMEKVSRVWKGIKEMKLPINTKLKLILAVATDNDDISKSLFKKEIDELNGLFPFETEVRFFGVNQLIKERRKYL